MGPKDVSEEGRATGNSVRDVRTLLRRRPVDILRVPARINILGEHIDYVSYLPTASLTLGSREHDMVLLFRASESGAVRGLLDAPGSDGLSVDLAEAPPPGAGGDWESYLYGRPARLRTGETT